MSQLAPLQHVHISPVWGRKARAQAEGRFSPRSGPTRITLRRGAFEGGSPSHPICQSGNTTLAGAMHLNPHKYMRFLFLLGAGRSCRDGPLPRLADAGRLHFAQFFFRQREIPPRRRDRHKARHTDRLAGAVLAAAVSELGATSKVLHREISLHSNSVVTSPAVVATALQSRFRSLLRTAPEGGRPQIAGDNRRWC